MEGKTLVSMILLETTDQCENSDHPDTFDNIKINLSIYWAPEMVGFKTLQ